jgi:endonuclease III
MLSDLNHFPHHFVLACLMDRHLGAERAWSIPYRVGLHLGGFKFSDYKKSDLKTFQRIFHKERLHRFRKNIMPTIFLRAIEWISENYGGNAKNIWANNPPCARVIRRFLEFDGAGPKIATMATNILVRQLKVPMRDTSAIDISADRQVMKYFQSRGLLRAGAKKEELIYLTREICPEYLGLLDLLAWEQGRLIKRSMRGIV